MVRDSRGDLSPHHFLFPVQFAVVADGKNGRDTRLRSPEWLSDFFDLRLPAHHPEPAGPYSRPSSGEQSTRCATRLSFFQ